MQKSKLRQFVLLFCFLFSTVWNSSFAVIVKDHISDIPIKESTVHGHPKSSSIQASINGHVLTVTFLENLGNVQIEVTTATGGTVDLTDIWTPNSYIAYITNTGDYVVTITLGNGDEYYGEFEVTD